jgi:hypothetical protein
MLEGGGYISRGDEIILGFTNLTDLDAKLEALQRKGQHEETHQTLRTGRDIRPHKVETSNSDSDLFDST